MSEGQGKGHIIAGVAMALGIGGLRVCDDIGRAGAKVASSADNFALAGARVGDDLSAAAKLGDEVVGGVRMPAGTKAGMMDDSLGGGSSLLREGLDPDLVLDMAEWSIELGLQLSEEPFGAEFEPPAREAKSRVTCPSVYDLGGEPERWRRLVEEGFGSACTPNLVYGRAVEDEGAYAMFVGHEAVPLQELAAACWSVGSGCIFLGCEGDCGPAIVEQVRAAVPRAASSSLDAYTRFRALGAASVQPAPAFVAIVRGDEEPGYTLVRGDLRSALVRHQMKRHAAQR